MRPKSSLFIAALCWSVRLTGAAQVYTYDPDVLPSEGQQHSRTLSPIEARLVLAQRAGAEDYHLGGLLTPGAIDAINDFGLRDALFVEENNEGQKRMPTRKKRVHFLIEVPDEEAIPSSSPSFPYTAQFSISPCPSVNSLRLLFIDLARQSLPSIYAQRSDDDVLTVMMSNPRWFTADDDLDNFFVWTVLHPSQSLEEFWESVDIQHDHYSADGSRPSYHITAILVPRQAAAAAKEQSQSAGREIWGSYAPPAHTADSTFASSTLTLHRRQQEEPLEPPSDVSPAQQTSSPFPGILPACFPSQSACESLTRNCTGHGSCTLAYTDTSHEEADYKRCYSCQCRPTVRNTTDADGNQRTETTIWAGPACQKRDVSVQFWMLAGVTVGIVFLVTFAVGSLFSVGDATLPSVIGAGVSGIGARGQRQ